MKFNFPLFRGFAAKAYKNIGGSYYPLEDVLDVFAYYFSAYEVATGRPHPHIKVEQIEQIIRKMPYIENDGNGSGGGDIDPDAYETLIDKHFQTPYRNCDYNVNHFFSGNIRLLRFYEEFY